ncbi:MAG TPA: NAD(P)/FAD-dependent oxidoreductase [Blastocatellia bacterium]|nr:NAD(P)/FAD-dependent oxidoreductase [Blastocatellia bacterium]
MNTAIVGGGIAGLTAAAYLARAGHTVTVLEKAHTPGGRARTETKQGFSFNFGPHALYRNGAGVKILAELGVEFTGKIAGTDGAYALDNGARHTLPGGFVSMLTTGLLNLPGKLEAAKLLAALPKLNAADYDDLTVREWLEQTVKHPKVQQLVQALFRVTTYANDPARQSAGAAIRQLQMGLSGGVYYLDYGWQTLVNGLRAVAEQAGAIIQTEASVAAVEPRAQGFDIQLANGKSHTASSVIIAASPTEAATLVKQNEPLTEWARTMIPVRAACLDVALAHLPEPHARFALGIDQPYYFSVHSATAQLAPDNGALIHAAKYLPTNSDADARTIEQELEEVFDLMQPGWRNVVVARRFLPRLTVTNALVTATNGGTRPGPAVPGLAGLFVTGDWVGSEGQLADASFASAKAAAEMIAQPSLQYATTTA